MTQYEVWFRIGNYRTAHSRIFATDWQAAQLIAESQFGHDSIISITMVT